MIEHLPVPGHIALRRLRMLLRPGGVPLRSTPNLYRLRNVVYLLRGRQLFDHFDLPEVRGYGHVLEYSAEHLSWQLRRAGFPEFAVELRNFDHTPNEPLDRMLCSLGAPLRRIPRYRDISWPWRRRVERRGIQVRLDALTARRSWLVDPFIRRG